MFHIQVDVLELKNIQQKKKETGDIGQDEG
jgi:hypothetical protein